MSLNAAMFSSRDPWLPPREPTPNARGPARAGPRVDPLRRVLLEVDGGAGLLELRLDGVGLLLGDALLDRSGRAVDEVLGLLEAEAGDRAHDLDHLDLLRAGACEDDVERRLLLRLGSRGATAATRCG